MAWTAPRDWTAITDGIVTASQLNTDVRDNLSFLGGTSDVTTGHTHTGAAGMGAATLSAVTLTSLGTLTFADQSANPDAAGELQMNGTSLLWYGSAVVNLSGADQAAGTASLRTLNQASATAAAAGNHVHTPTTPNQLILDTGAALNTDTESNVGSGTIVVQGASEALAVVMVFVIPDGSGNAYTIRSKFSGPTSGTIDTTTSLAASASDIHILPSASGTAGIITPAAAGTFTITGTIERTSGSSSFNPKVCIYAREVGA
jgi:hypothetical protein